MTDTPSRRAGAAEPEETGWLIESPGSGQPHWWPGGYPYTADSLKAVRFARREDAEAVMRYMPDGHLLRATEHVWLARPIVGPCAGAAEPEMVTIKANDWSGVRIERDRYALRHSALVRQVETILRVLDETGRCTPKQHRQWEKELDSNRWY